MRAEWLKLLESSSQIKGVSTVPPRCSAEEGMKTDTHIHAKASGPEQAAELPETTALHDACLNTDVERVEELLIAEKQQGFDKLRLALASRNAKLQTPLVRLSSS